MSHPISPANVHDVEAKPILYTMGAKWVQLVQKKKKALTSFDLSA